MDSRLAWYSTGSGFLEDGSNTLLHSIYGSQVSQLPFSNPVSEASLATSSEQQLVSRRTLTRPKSSPAVVTAARCQLRGSQRPTSAAVRPNAARRPTRPVVRPNSAAVRPNSAAVRPNSAAVGRRVAWGRPGSAVSPMRGGASPIKRRPQSAMPHRAAVGLAIQETGEAPIIRETAPVQVTQTPEYFDFWHGKPLSVREYGVKVHKRKLWVRSRTDHGSGAINRGRGDKENRTSGSGGLATLEERDSGLNSRRGSWDTGCHGNTNNDSSNDQGGDGLVGVASEGAFAGGRGSQETDGDQHNSKSRLGIDGSHGDGSHGDDRGLRGRDNRSSDETSGQREGGMRGGARNTSWADLADTSDADNDNYFKNKALAAASWLEEESQSSSTRFELPMDLRTLEGMSPREYLSSHCIISKRRMANSSKVFKMLDKEKRSFIDTQRAIEGIILVHHSCVTREQAASVLELLDITTPTIDLKLFAAVCCFAERMLNLFFLPISRKDIIETVDFEALDWKLRDCSVNEQLRTVFALL